MKMVGRKTAKATVTVDDAWETKIVIDEPVDEYAKKFLAIFNNVRNQSFLIGVTNDSGNGVYVSYTQDGKELYGVEEWLSQFGKVVETYPIKYGEVWEYGFPVPDDCFDTVVIKPYLCWA